jgi:hypothetical protein
VGVRIVIGGAKGIGLRTVVPLVPLLILLVGMAIAEASFASSPTIRYRPLPCTAVCLTTDANYPKTATWGSGPPLYTSPNQMTPP